MITPTPIKILPIFWDEHHFMVPLNTWKLCFMVAKHLKIVNTTITKSDYPFDPKIHLNFKKVNHGYLNIYISDSISSGN